MVDVACHYQPVTDRVLIKLDPVQNKSEGGILPFSMFSFT